MHQLIRSLVSHGWIIVRAFLYDIEERWMTVKVAELSYKLVIATPVLKNLGWLCRHGATTAGASDCHLLGDE
jgi:hypothetical protein